MENFENIVVGLDISKNSVSILQRAFNLAQKNNSKVTIAHAVDSSWFTELFSPTKFDELKARQKESIEDLISQTNVSNIEYKILIHKETASTFVVDTAKELNACLIVIGANEKENKDIALLGSTAHKIAQNSKLPLLIVKNSYDKEYNNFVAFTDLSEISYKSLLFAKEFFHKQTIKTVYTYSQMSDLALQYYNKVEEKDDIRSDIQAKEEDKFNKFVTKYDLKDIESIESEVGISAALLEFVETNQNDLVVLGSKGVHNSTSFFYGSTTSFLMENLKSDLLIYVPHN